MTGIQRLAALYRAAGLPGWYLWLKLRILPLDACSRFMPREGTILDVGCGYGFLANFLSLEHASRRVIGNDPDLPRIAVARRTVGSRGNIEFLDVDSRSLPVRDLDGVLMADVLHHVPYEEQQVILRDLYRKLKQGGTLLIRETNKVPDPRYILLHCVLETLLYLGKERMRFRRAGEWSSMLQSVGFTIRHTESSPLHALYLTTIFVCTK